MPSPLGELDRVDHEQFFAAAAELPEHRAAIEAALRSAWRDYGSFAAGVSRTRKRLRELNAMPRMVEHYRDAYAMAFRGGDAFRRCRPAARQATASAAP